MNTTQRVVVVPEEPMGEINPYVHGQFAEHLGELVYHGIYVRPGQNIPNTNGIRNDVVAALKPLGISVLRWPGGCFADDYHWRDGIGPVDRRPLRINRHWGGAEETNEFGTHEFMAFCRAIGAEPYFAANLGSAAPSEMRDWIEYCNFAGRSALADERRANGSEEPFNVRYWGVGNENWGCGGHMSPEHYAEEFSRYRSYAGAYSGTRVQAIACGQNGNDWAWTTRFFEHLSTRNYKNRLRAVQGYAVHYYCRTAGTATQYTNEQWLELLARAYAIEGILIGARGIMDQYDPERKLKLIFDEWGTWHPVEEGKPTGGLYQQNTVRDACVAALTLDVFQNHADEIFMANIAQLINVLQALLLVEEDRCIKTPTYHVFDLYRPHKGAQSVRFLTYADGVTNGGESADHCRACYLNRDPFQLRAVHGSASVRDETLCVTAVNTHPTETVELEVEVHRARWHGEVEAVLLASDDIHAHNTHSNPDRVKLSDPQTLNAQGSQVRVTLPPGGIVRLMGRLG